MPAYARKSGETFSLRKILSPWKLGKKAGIFAVNTWKPLSILEKLWWLKHHFIVKKNKRLNTRLRKPNYESSLVALYYKVEENYFKGKIWVLYKLKTNTSGKGYSFAVIFAHFCHCSNVSHLYPHNYKCQFDVKLGSLSMQVTPKISY